MHARPWRSDHSLAVPAPGVGWSSLGRWESKAGGWEAPPVQGLRHVDKGGRAQECLGASARVGGT